MILLVRLMRLGSGVDLYVFDEITPATEGLFAHITPIWLHLRVSSHVRAEISPGCE